jgi:glycosyltransferase involved in cell wall biosynthesis
MTEGPRILVMTVVHRPDDARILHRQISTLTAQGFHVTYAAPCSATGVVPPEGLANHDLPRAAGRHRLDALMGAVRLLRRDARAHDLVLIHDPELLVAVRFAGVDRLPPVVWDVHEDTAVALGDREWVPRPLRRLLRLAVQRLEAWAERHVHLILAEDGYRPRFRRAHPVVRNYPWARPLPEPFDMEQGSRTEDGRRRVAYVGRLSEGRGLREMIEIGEMLRATHVVELFGPPDAGVQSVLEEAVASGHVRWHGYLPNDRVGEALHGAVAGLSLLSNDPNYMVSMPSKVLEYLSHGVPVIATPLPSVVELLEEHGGGMLVPFGDAPAAAAAVQRLTEDPALVRRLVEEGRVAAAQRTWETEGGRLASTLRGWAAR